MEATISLNQIGLYNPQRQTAEVTEKLFVVRQKQFELLLGKVLQEKENSIPQHYLIIGQRGMGKTTILKRMEVELHKEQYRQKFIPLLFREEQYNVKDLAEFWLNSLDALADSLESEKCPKETLEAIDKTTKELSIKSSKTISEEAYQFLMDTCRGLHRRPVLLVDNIGLVFSRLDGNSKTKKEQYILRKLLSENAAPIVVSAGVAVFDDVINYGLPFYDFFQIQYLRKLDYDEFSTLLKNLATVTNSDETVFVSLQKNASRQKSLLELTGGSPRTTVMLFKHIVKGFSADINDDLEALADEITPLYKAKFEELPTQQQLILDAIAMNWDAVSLRKLATATGMQNNQLSPQLKRLVEEGWIETTPAYKSKGNAYFISERFFNIWYLVRNSARRDKEKIYCLSRFLECFYEKEDLERMSDGFLQKDICHPKDIWYGYALAETLKKDNRKKALQIEDKTYTAALQLSKTDDKVCEEFAIYAQKGQKQSKKSTSIDRPFIWIQKGWKFEDKQEHDKARTCYDKVIECCDKLIELNLKDENAWFWKGYVLDELQRYEESLDCYDKVIELNPKDENAWFGRGYVLSKLQRYEESLACYDKAIELNPKDDVKWNNKGYVLIELHSFEKATDALEQSISINPNNLSPKFHLLFLYRDILGEMNKATELFNSINEKEVHLNANKNFVCRYYLHKALFELYKQNKGIATEYLLQAFEILEKENKLSSMSKEDWWMKFGSVVNKLGYGVWLLNVLEEKGYDVVLSPYYTALQALEIEKQYGQEDAEIYLKNRAVEISKPARLIIEKMRKYLD